MLASRVRRGGRREWLRVARLSLRSTAPSRHGRSRVIVMIGCLTRVGRFEENQRVELAANEAYEHWRATARDTKGRVMKGNSKPFDAAGGARGRDQPVRPGLAG